MIRATVSSWSCFCWLYRASPSLAAKHIINLISVLTIWWCPCIEPSFVLLEEGICYDQCVWQYSVRLCPGSFCTPRPNSPVTPGISSLPTFVFQSPIMKRTFWGVLVLEGLVYHHRTFQLQLLQHYWLGLRVGLLNLSKTKETFEELETSCFEPVSGMRYWRNLKTRSHTIWYFKKEKHWLIELENVEAVFPLFQQYHKRKI